MADKAWAQIVELAEHYKAIGQTEVWLSREKGYERGLPWEHVVSVEPGSMHRLGTAVSVGFVAKHPCGLRFRWSFDIEDDGANGTGSFKVNVARIERVMDELPEKMRGQFRAYLAACAQAVAKSADEYEAIAGRTRSTAARLALMASGE